MMKVADDPTRRAARLLLDGGGEDRGVGEAHRPARLLGRRRWRGPQLLLEADPPPTIRHRRPAQRARLAEGVLPEAFLDGGGADRLAKGLLRGARFRGEAARLEGPRGEDRRVDGLPQRRGASSSRDACTIGDAVMQPCNHDATQLMQLLDY